jgi:hypothetical protein
MNEEKPSSAYPDPLSPLLALIVRGALEAYESNEVDVEGAILNAAVNGWYEGHIEGEECGGCSQSDDVDEVTKHLRKYPG